MMENLLDDTMALIPIIPEEELKTESFVKGFHKWKNVWVLVKKGKMETGMEFENKNLQIWSFIH